MLDQKRSSDAVEPADTGPLANTDVPALLMRMALALLDREGETIAACHLQQAIDSYLQKDPAAPGPELDAEIAAWMAANPIAID